MSDVTRILSQLEAGDSWAAEQLLPLVYNELRKLAQKHMAAEAAGHTLQPTALVHEAYLRLVGTGEVRGWDNRGHFYAAAAVAMRRILIESARRRTSAKRGGGLARLELGDPAAESTWDDSATLLALDEALSKLEIDDPDSARLVTLRYFGGLTFEEAAAAMGVSLRTAKRNWSYARAWLQREIERE